MYAAPVVAPDLHVLVVCTGNLCRSPMAAAMLEARLRQRGVDAVVESAGFVTEGKRASFPAVELLAERGIDLAAHRSRRVGALDLSRPDLVLCMERRHVRELTVLDRSVFERSFTLPDLARRAVAHGPRRPGESVRDWLARIGADRRIGDLLGVDPDDEVEDPYGRPTAAYVRTAQRIDELLDAVLPRLLP